MQKIFKRELKKEMIKKNKNSGNTIKIRNKREKKERKLGGNGKSIKI